MSIHQINNNQDTPTETVWTPNSSHNDGDMTTPVQVTTTVKTPYTSINSKKLKKNTERVLDIIATQQTRNATQAYKQIYPNASDITARNNASQLLKQTSSQVYLQQHTTQAVNNILELANTARSELVRLNANQDILDRNFGKATIKQEQVSTGVTLVINLTGDSDS
jgi:hypothetical protein